jgi:hypothetical protein
MGLYADKPRPPMCCLTIYLFVDAYKGRRVPLSLAWQHMSLDSLYMQNGPTTVVEKEYTTLQLDLFLWLSAMSTYIVFFSSTASVKT